MKSDKALNIGIFVYGLSFTLGFGASGMQYFFPILAVISYMTFLFLLWLKIKGVDKG